MKDIYTNYSTNIRKIIREKNFKFPLFHFANDEEILQKMEWDYLFSSLNFYIPMYLSPLFEHPLQLL